MQFNSLIYGVDVAKDELVDKRFDDPGLHRLANKEREIRCWLRQLPKGSIVAMESTSSYHQLLARLAHAAGMHVYVLNARRVHQYAQGLGVRGKTDRIDAGVIARYVSERLDKLHEWQPGSAEQTRIDELLRRRAVAMAKFESIRQSFRGCKDLLGVLKQLERAFRSCIKSIETQINELIKADETLRASRRRISTVIGFGPVGSALLAVLLARIPFANADALVAYSGWDPLAKDSGSRRGKRRLSKWGPAYMRKQWYMAGFTAGRTKALKPLYQALLAKGFATTEAFVILGRKLLRAAYAVWKTGRPFDLQKFLGTPRAA